MAFKVSEISVLIAEKLRELNGFTVISYFNFWFDIFWRGKYLCRINDDGKTIIRISRLHKRQYNDINMIFNMNENNSIDRLIKYMKRNRIRARGRAWQILNLKYYMKY